MESFSYPGLKLREVEKQSYVHRIILSEPLSKFEQIQNSLTNEKNTAESLVVEFDFKQPGILSNLQHRFRFHLWETLHNGPFLEENISGSAMASQRHIFISKMLVSFHYNGNSEYKYRDLMKHSVTPKRLVVQTAGFTSWTSDFRVWDNFLTEIKITVEIIQGWESGIIHGIESIKLRSSIRPKPAQENSKYFLSPELSDFIIQCGETKWSAHRFVLCKSPVFEKMMQPDFKEGREGMVEITDIAEPVMIAFLQFLYCDNVENLDLYAKELLIAATKYMLEDLAYDCVCSLANNLTETNVLEIYRLSILLEIKSLKEYSQFVFKLYKNQIVKSLKIFKQIAEEFPELIYSACFLFQEDGILV